MLLFLRLTQQNSLSFTRRGGMFGKLRSRYVVSSVVEQMQTLNEAFEAKVDTILATNAWNFPFKFEWWQCTCAPPELVTAS